MTKQLAQASALLETQTKTLLQQKNPSKALIAALENQQQYISMLNAYASENRRPRSAVQFKGYNALSHHQNNKSLPVRNYR